MNFTFFLTCFFTLLCNGMANPILEKMEKIENIPITNTSTCETWTNWLSDETYPAVVMQVVSEQYIDLELNFIRLMELNSNFTRDHMYLMCLDDKSIEQLKSHGVRCVPANNIPFHSTKDIWRMRIRALSCIMKIGHNVIISDIDALWLKDPMEYFNMPHVIQSRVSAQRALYPAKITNRWHSKQGNKMGIGFCMGFVFFRSGPGMDTLQEAMEKFVLESGDDQIALDAAIDSLGVVFDKESDMRYIGSREIGKGTVNDLYTDRTFDIAFLPHNKFTRNCNKTPISNETIIAHCNSPKTIHFRRKWMEEENLYSTEMNISH